MHAYMHTCIHAFMHSCIHTYIHIYIYITLFTYTYIMFTQQYVHYLVDTLSKALDAHVFQNLWSRIWEMSKKNNEPGFWSIAVCNSTLHPIVQHLRQPLWLAGDPTTSSINSMFNITKKVMQPKYTNYTNRIWKLQVRLTGGIVIEHYWAVKRCDFRRGQVAISCLLVLVGFTPLRYLDEWFDLSIFQLFWRAEAIYVVSTIIVMYLLIELNVFRIRWNAVVDLSVTQAHLCFVPNKLSRRHWQMPCRTWDECWGKTTKNTCADIHFLILWMFYNVRPPSYKLVYKPQ